MLLFTNPADSPQISVHRVADLGGGFRQVSLRVVDVTVVDLVVRRAEVTEGVFEVRMVAVMVVVVGPADDRVIRVVMVVHPDRVFDLMDGRPDGVVGRLLLSAPDNFFRGQGVVQRPGEVTHGVLVVLLLLGRRRGDDRDRRGGRTRQGEQTGSGSENDFEHDAFLWTGGV